MLVEPIEKIKISVCYKFFCRADIKKYGKMDEWLTSEK